MRAKNLLLGAKEACADDCGCILCLELRQGMTANLHRASPVRIGTTAASGNFILRRPPLPYVNRAPTREWQEADEESDSQERIKNNHKTVIYFGDTNPRCKPPEDKVVETDPGDAPVVQVSVKPSREDVLRIQEDQSKLEDYWSLPGDTTGFRADWSFVQQWRLRG